MNYFPFHIGDYRSATMHLSNDEDLAYRRLIEWYYDTEKPIPVETQWVSRRLRVETEALETVLRDFFVLTDDGWKNDRCEREIAEYRNMRERNRGNGAKGGRPRKEEIPEKQPEINPVETQKNPVGFQSQPTGKATNNQEPVTSNQEPVKRVEAKQQRGSRLPADWSPSSADAMFCKTERPYLDVSKTADRFRDYWHAQPGAKGSKLDWSATWRNWVRNESKQQSFGGLSAKDAERQRVADQMFRRGEYAEPKREIDISGTAVVVDGQTIRAIRNDVWSDVD